MDIVTIGALRIAAHLTDDQVCALLAISARTYRRYQKNPTTIPAAVRLCLQLLSGDLGLINKKWKYWLLRPDTGELWPLENDRPYTPGDLRSIFWMKQQIRGYRQLLAAKRDDRGDHLGGILHQHPATKPEGDHDGKNREPHRVNGSNVG